MTPATVIAFDGAQKSIKEWALDYGLTPGIIIARINRGTPICDALTMPMMVAFSGQKLPVFHPRQRDRKTMGNHRHAEHLADGQKRRLSEWAEHLGITYNTLCTRIHRLGGLEAVVAQHATRQASTAQGVVSDLPPSVGTGGGRTAQETTEITFSEKALKA